MSAVILPAAWVICGFKSAKQEIVLSGSHAATDAPCVIQNRLSVTVHEYNAAVRAHDFTLRVIQDHAGAGDHLHRQIIRVHFDAVLRDPKRKSGSGLRSFTRILRRGDAPCTLHTLHWHAYQDY
jgi:hypothetical protein